MLKQIPRQIVFELLSSDSGASGFIEERMTRAFESDQVDSRDRRFIQSLCYGVLRNLSLLDWIIDREVTRKPPGGSVRTLLRMGIYQLFFMDRVAEHAAINETVECARRAGLERQSGFINGLLRNALRHLDATTAAFAELQAQEPWVRFSHPQWLYEKLASQFGPEPVLKWMAWNNEPAEVFLAPNLRQTSPQDLVRRLETEGCYVQVLQAPVLRDQKCLKWISGVPPQSTGSFSEGLFYIQDPSTHVAPMWIRAQSGESVLDLCAAPGGKTQLLAQLLPEGVRISAADAEDWRVERLRQNLARMKLIERVRIFDEAIPAQERFDWILVDAPCSNTGVLRRRVELRWRIGEDECSELASLQLDLLRRARALLKPRGKIVYSTCSLDADENEKTVRSFQQEFPEFTLLQQRRLTPWEDTVDGAFIACLAAR